MLVFIDWHEYSAFRIWETDMIHKLVDGWMQAYFSFIVFDLLFLFSRHTSRSWHKYGTRGENGWLAGVSF
jgi:hypothetical protein